MNSIQILGSAAAEAIPAIFCNCRVCQEAWKNGGKDFRMRSAYKINDRVRVDFGPDSVAQDHRFKLHSENIKHLFFTHSHEDHLDPDLLSFRSGGMSHPENVLNVYGNIGVVKKVAAAAYPLEDYKIDLHLIKYFEPVELPDEDMTFYPMKANHMLTEFPMYFIIRHGTKHIAIISDTGVPEEENWKFMREHNIRLDCVIAECTGLLLDIARGHMGGEPTIALKKRMESEGFLNPGASYVINHFSHNGKLTHREAEEHFGPYGIQVGYDGMIVEY